MRPSQVTAAAARRLLLGAQGLLDDPRRKASLSALRRLLERLGFVQLDSINVVARAQHLTLRTRLLGYDPAQLETLLESERFLFEHWTHDASAVPTALYPHWRHRFPRAEARILANKWWLGQLGPDRVATLAAVRAHVLEAGEVRAEDFDTEKIPRGTSAWWSWKREKAALEYLWHTGELAVTRRVHFQKVYALADHVLPDARVLPAPSPLEHLDWACAGALERLGVATPRELSAYWAAVPLADARRWTVVAAKAKRIVPVEVLGASGEATIAWAWPDWKERASRLPDPPEGLHLLCPFDPILRDRARALRLFGFDYRFEAFVPPPKRKYGYYVLPILEGDGLIGRIDPKLHRDAGLLEVKGVFWEKGFEKRARVVALEEAVGELARWLGADRVEMPRPSGAGRRRGR
jgi:uncharacterized protein